MREVELLAVGAGPANLALAVALEELAPAGLAENSLVIERGPAVEWQTGLLLPWTKSQVSFVKDLVTLRDPTSRFSFLNYLHSVGRLNDFTNMGSFLPYRLEISGYLSWVAESLARVRIEVGRECSSLEPRRDDRGRLVGWLARLTDGTAIASRYLVIGVGREPYYPPVFAGLPEDRVVHSTQYRTRLARLAKEMPYRVAVIGGAQSAAEMFRALQGDLPNSDLVLVMRGIGLRAPELTKFTNELYYPSFVDELYGARPEGREQILQDMERTNYSSTMPDLLESLYADRYLDRLTGTHRRRFLPLSEVTGARMAGGELLLELTDRKTGTTSVLPRDLVFLGTGFRREMPPLIRRLAARLGLDRVEVSRRYRLVTGDPSEPACYLQGVNEATHGIADSLLSIAAHRAADITADILAHRVGADAWSGAAGSEANGDGGRMGASDEDGRAVAPIAVHGSGPR
jgi:L-ornithine N5-oxygenase